MILNNVTFGDGNFGYYETLAGGANAREKRDGRLEALPGAINYTAEAGAGLIIETPGGGGSRGLKRGDR